MPQLPDNEHRSLGNKVKKSVVHMSKRLCFFKSNSNTMLQLLHVLFNTESMSVAVYSLYHAFREPEAAPCSASQREHRLLGTGISQKGGQAFGDFLCAAYLQCFAADLWARIKFWERIFFVQPIVLRLENSGSRTFSKICFAVHLKFRTRPTAN